MDPRHQVRNPAFIAPTVGAYLEQLIFKNSKQYFNKSHNSKIQDSTPINKWKEAAHRIGEDSTYQNGTEQRRNLITNDFDDLEYDDSNLCTKRCCWWNPSQDSISVTFCNETSIHGFRFLGKRQRHLTERIFWLFAFLLGLTAAVYLIYGVWERYEKVPVIVSFQPNEQDIDSIPFPAITFCNMNKFPRTKVRELQRIAGLPRHEKYNEAILQLKFVRSVCNAQQSFAKDFDFAFNRGTDDRDSVNDTITEDNQDEMMDFLLANTIPCDQFIRHCMLGEEKQNCSKIFKPVITDYGKCCTFNILPLPLLLKNPQTFGKENWTLYDNPVLGSNAEVNWPESELNEWKQWNYEDGFVLKQNLSKPWKQRRAGLPYGLSILVDPNTEEYYCPVSDSEGMRYLLHTPLEMPHIMEFGSVADLNKEILIEVHPDITNADDDIRRIEYEKRKCYFGLERKLNFFGPYTAGNCIDECTAIVLGETCHCTFFYMPRDDGVRICNNDPDSYDFHCIEMARIDLQATLKDKCGHCDTLCEDITYNYETTIAELQNAKQLWFDHNPSVHGNVPPQWAHHKMSIIHIYFGSETTVPKYRKRLYGTTDLIANTGGILGLCLGFSILSGVEVIYFLTLRSFWKCCRRRMHNRRVASAIVNIFKSSKSNKVIRVNPKKIPVYANSGYAQMWGRQIAVPGPSYAPNNMYNRPLYFGGGNMGYNY